MSRQNEAGEKMNKTAVLNFLTSLDGSMKIVENILNANRDSVLYKWNETTLKAIIKGIWIKKEGEIKFKEYLKKIGDR